MKIILAIICGLVVLFAGGCAVILLISQVSDSGAAVLALLPGAIAVLNLLILLGLYGRQPPKLWAFYLLAGLDVLAAIGAAIFWSSISFQVSDIWTLAVPVIAVLVVKAVLTVMVARQLQQPGGTPPQG